MSYIVTKRINGHDYRYLVKSVREGDRVRQVFVRYLGPVGGQNVTIQRRGGTDGQATGVYTTIQWSGGRPVKVSNHARYTPSKAEVEPMSEAERRRAQKAGSAARRRRRKPKSAGLGPHNKPQIADKDVLGPSAGGGGKRTQ